MQIEATQLGRHRQRDAKVRGEDPPDDAALHVGVAGGLQQLARVEFGFDGGPVGVGGQLEGVVAAVAPLPGSVEHGGAQVGAEPWRPPGQVAVGLLLGEPAEAQHPHVGALAQQRPCRERLGRGHQPAAACQHDLQLRQLGPEKFEQHEGVLDARRGRARRVELGQFLAGVEHQHDGLGQGGDEQGEGRREGAQERLDARTVGDGPAQLLVEGQRGVLEVAEGVRGPAVRAVAEQLVGQGVQQQAGPLLGVAGVEVVEVGPGDREGRHLPVGCEAA
ncbi:hypothetical protein ACFQGX_38735 [Nonomuraea dietziae]|uniref:hypothetical protein n=1 Tax=Nonomuraea dietziae TaxID=65515 RepID=UPI003622A32F